MAQIGKKGLKAVQKYVDNPEKATKKASQLQKTPTGRIAGAVLGSSNNKKAKNANELVQNFKSGRAK